MTKINSVTILKTYLKYVKKYPVRTGLLLLVTPLANISFRMIPPLIAATVINKLSKGQYIKGDLWASFSNEIWLFALFTLLGGIVLWRVAIYLVWTLESYITRDINRDMLNKYLELDSQFHADNFGGSLTSRTSKLTGAYVRVQDTIIFQFYLLIIAYISITIIMYNKSLNFVIFMWLFTIVYIFVSFFITKSVRKVAAEEADAYNKVTANLADAITNILSIKSFAKRKYENERFAKTTENARRKSINLMWKTIYRDTFSSTVTSLIAVIALIIAIYSVVNKNMDIAVVFLIFTYTMDITERLWEFNSSALRNFNRAIGDATEGIKTLLTEPKVKDPTKPEPFLVKEPTIHFDNIDFAHEGNSVLFSKFNLSIKSGSKIGLVGHSGSGKTTLVRLLMRYMDLDNGQIKISGQNIAQITQEDLRNQIAYVAQEPMLFHRSLAENISYGKLNTSTAEIEEVARKAHAHEFIQDLAKGYQTLVGERGVKLSGGQRQRVAIARAMLKDAPILVLDEATSALDSESEVLVQDALWKLMQNKTAIVIAHRLSTIQKMDRIIVLDKGKIIEDGSHQELLQKNGKYTELWNHQSGGFLTE